MPFARRALGNATPRANKKKERKRKGRTHRYSIGWKGRTEQSWGWSRTCFFLLLVSRFVCFLRVDVLCPFFSPLKEKEGENQNNGLGYLLFSHPKHRRGPNSLERRRSCTAQSDAIEIPRVAKREGKKKKKKKKKARTETVPRAASLSASNNDCESRKISSSSSFVLFSSCRARARRTKTRSSSASLA